MIQMPQFNGPVGGSTIKNAFAAQPQSAGGFWGGLPEDRMQNKTGLVPSVVPPRPIDEPIAQTNYQSPPYIPNIPAPVAASYPATGNTGAGLVASAFQPNGVQNWWSGTYPGQTPVANKPLRIPRWPMGGPTINY